MNVHESGRLPCGSELAELIAQVADDSPPANPEHQASCRHCQAALRELDSLWGRVRELAREEVSAPYTIVRTVMRRIRALSLPPLPIPLEDVVPQLVRHALVRQERGTTRIADSVLAGIVGLTLREFPAVEPAGGALERVRGRFRGAAKGVEIAVTDEGVIVDLRLIVDYGLPLPSVAELVRAQIVERIAQMTGIAAIEVNVLVEDVRPSPE